MQIDGWRSARVLFGDLTKWMEVELRSPLYSVYDIPTLGIGSFRACRGWACNKFANAVLSLEASV